VRWAWLVVASALALAGGCRGSPLGVAPTSTASSASPSAAAPSPSAPEPAAADALRDEARIVLERHCGQCHVRDYPTALPRALAVFDLREPDWSACMSDAQFRSALWRLGEPLPPDGRPSDVGPDERARFQSYVDAELARRARAGSGPGR
jgi:hypothetical protein